MTETVEQAEIAARWNPNIEHAVLVVSEEGLARLLLRAHPDDDDKRSVEIIWRGVVAARMEPPNDEARPGHPLSEAGLGEVRWAGEVRESRLVAELERRNRVHPRHDAARYTGLRHWVLPLKGTTVEVVAESLEVGRRSRDR